MYTLGSPCAPQGLWLCTSSLKSFSLQTLQPHPLCPHGIQWHCMQHVHDGQCRARAVPRQISVCLDHSTVRPVPFAILGVHRRLAPRSRVEDRGNPLSVFRTQFCSCTRSARRSVGKNHDCGTDLSHFSTAWRLHRVKPVLASKLQDHGQVAQGPCFCSSSHFSEPSTADHRSLSEPDGRWLKSWRRRPLGTVLHSCGPAAPCGRPQPGCTRRARCQG